MAAKLTRVETSDPSPVPALFARLIDDAAMFPPAQTPLLDAYAAHREHRAAWYAELVGPLVCADRNLPELAGAADAPLEVSVLVTGGAGAIEPAITWATRADELRPVALEIALRDGPDVGRNARRVAMAADDAVPEDVAVYVELPRGTEAVTALDVLAETEHHAKLRTGGADPDAFPSERELADFITACLDRQVAFKLTAGLHHPIRNTDAATGFEQHGFANVLLATRAALDGASVDDLVTLLAQRDPDAVVAGIRGLNDARAQSVRRWFRSFGSCSIAEPRDELGALGLLGSA